MKIRSRSVTERDRRVRARLTSQVSILSSPLRGRRRGPDLSGRGLAPCPGFGLPARTSGRGVTSNVVGNAQDVVSAGTGRSLTGLRPQERSGLLQGPPR